jgi:5-formyltetrahydrofolate cyclo-ligase
MSLDLPQAPVSGTPEQTAQWRQTVRRALLTWRKALDVDTHAELSAKNKNHFASFLKDHPTATVGFYWPIQNEVDLRTEIKSHIALGGKAALPVVPGKDQPMVFHNWTPQTKLMPGYAGIPEPVETPKSALDIILAPLVGFDNAGYRLGYGGGFFDRTLAVLSPKPIVVGIGFEATRLEDIQPHQYDVPVDVLITDAGIRDIGY